MAPSRPLRVLFVNDHLGYGGGVVHGVTRYFLNVIPRLDSRVVQAEACFLRGPHPAAKQLRDAGVEPIFLGRRKHDPRAMGDLVRLVRERAVDILHLAGMKSMLLGRLAARRVGCRAVIHLHDTQSLGPVLGFLQRRLADSTDAALGVSEAVRQLAIDEFGIDARRAATLHNGVPIAEFASPPPKARQTIRRELQIDADAPVVGMLGRLSYEKQPKLFISAMPELLNKRPGTVLLLVGDGPLRSECERLANRLALTRSIRFAGQRADVPSMLAAMDLVANASSREGFPYSMIEACAAGKPVVGFSVGGLREIVLDNDSGLLIAPQDASALVEAVARVLADPVLASRLAAGARRRASLYEIESHVRALEALYARVAGADTVPYREFKHA
jgi:glycosyltransferase involved in cell wall biosynthesis